MSEFGWQFWSDAQLLNEVRGVRIFAKEGYYCVCEPGIEPGDADSFIRGTMLSGFALFWQLVDEGEYSPDGLTAYCAIQN